MRDQDIRCSLRAQLVFMYGHDPSTLIVDELGICTGLARVDMAVVNGELKGFEIKSDRDTLSRLPGQSHLYGRVFDTMTIVVGPRHLEKAKSIAPVWWGIMVATADRIKPLELTRVRSETENTDHDALSVSQLLWRDEALEVLEKSGLVKGLRNRPRRCLWEALASNFCLSDLRRIVREQLKRRRNWRVAAAHTQRGGRSPLSAKS